MTALPPRDGVESLQEAALAALQEIQGGRRGFKARNVETRSLFRDEGAPAATRDIAARLLANIVSYALTARIRSRLLLRSSSGEYGLVCRRDSPAGTTEAIYVRGPFRIG